MNVEVFQVAANLCLEPKFSSGRHRPHSRLNDWHTIDYDEELFTDLSFCSNSTKHLSEVQPFTGLARDFSVLKERNCSTSTPLVTKNPEKFIKDRNTPKCRGKLVSVRETNDTCDSGFGETDVVSTFTSSCTLQTPVSSLNNGHQKCPNYDLESDCPIFLQPLPCLSLEQQFEPLLEKDLKQANLVHTRTSDQCDSGFESHNLGCSSESSSIIKQNEASFSTKIAELLDKFSPKNHEALIGRRIGEEQVDIVGLLHTKNIDPPLWKICGYLTGEDLCTFRCVSKAWNTIIETDKCVKCRWKKQVATKRVPWNKENKLRRSPRKQTGLTAGKQTPLSSLQPTAARSNSNQSCTEDSSRNIVPLSPSKAGPLTRHQVFVRAASGLKQGECLRKCPLCSSPSRTDTGQERAWCLGVSCRYDFCIQCRSPFHGAKPCTTGISKKTRTEGGGVGSRKSKKNLRRL